MVAYKTGSFRSALRSIDPLHYAALVYGPDAGLVAERAASLAEAFAAKHRGVMETVRLDDKDLAEDPTRLEVELRTIPMFAEGKVVRVSAGAKLDVPMLRALLDTPFVGALILEAGSLRTDSALRKLFETHTTAAAVASYVDEDLTSQLIDEELEKAGLTIDSDTRAYLMARLGADQAMSRAEVAKLALFAAGQGRISPDDIDAIVGDSAEIAIDKFVYDVSGGDAKNAVRQLGRLAAAGTEPSVALSGLGRHFVRLHHIASAQATGTGIDQVVRSFRPPLNHNRKNAILADSRRLGAERLLAALPLIQEAVKRARLNPDLERAIAERLVLTLTRRGEKSSSSRL
jgi:DNA polymerase III subunit delta